MPTDEELVKCRQDAMRLLKFRARSSKELKERLETKGHSSEVVDTVLEYCRKHRFLDDKLFALVWARSRAKKPFGYNRIRRELLAKGISQEFIDEVFREIKQEYHEEEAIEGIVKARLLKYKGLEPRKIKARLFGFLLRRGFSQDRVMEVVSRI